MDLNKYIEFEYGRNRNIKNKLWKEKEFIFLMLIFRLFEVFSFLRFEIVFLLFVKFLW